MSASGAGTEGVAGSSARRANQDWVLAPPPAGPVTVGDRSVPADVSVLDLSSYCLMLGDDALVLSWRLSQWCHRTPELEEDVALMRIGLELLEQARVLLDRAGELEGAGRDSDHLVRMRAVEQFRNVRLVEVDCGPGAGGDFATSIARMVVCATWRAALFDRLVPTRDPVLSGLAESLLSQARRHRDHAAQWVIRLGDDTGESRRRVLSGFERVWPMMGELFASHPVELRLAETDCAVEPSALRTGVVESLDEVLSVARLEPPGPRMFGFSSEPVGRAGVHTESLQFLLAELRAAGATA